MSESLSKRATNRGVRVRSVICLCVTESMMLYAIAMPVRSSGVTENFGEVGVISPGSGGNDVTPMSTSPERKSSRAWFDAVFVMSIVNACAPVHSAAAHW